MTGLPEGAALRPGLETVHFDCDTLVFDVDGVLVDVRESFREVIRATAAGVQRLMAVSVPWTPARDDITLFKRAGGFNDDIEMSIAMTAIGAGGRGGDVARLAQAVEDAGGGLRALRAVAPELPRIDGQVLDPIPTTNDSNGLRKTISDIEGKRRSPGGRRILFGRVHAFERAKALDNERE